MNKHKGNTITKLDWIIRDIIINGLKMREPRAVYKYIRKIKKKRPTKRRLKK